jgi:hypothetical protein
LKEGEAVGWLAIGRAMKKARQARRKANARVFGVSLNE